MLYFQTLCVKLRLLIFILFPNRKFDNKHFHRHGQLELLRVFWISCYALNMVSVAKTTLWQKQKVQGHTAPANPLKREKRYYQITHVVHSFQEQFHGRCGRYFKSSAALGKTTAVEASFLRPGFCFVGPTNCKQQTTLNLLLERCSGRWSSLGLPVPRPVPARTPPEEPK